MSKKIFSNEEIINLKVNKYVKNVSKKGITYTTEFRKEYTNLMVQGKKKREIFISMGFDPKVLGEKRMESMHKRMQTNLKMNKSIEDTRTTNSGRRRKNESKNLNETEEIEKLKHENVLLKAENDLLKKMEFLVMQKELENSRQRKDIN